jgi:hypothetical protein
LLQRLGELRLHSSQAMLTTPGVAALRRTLHDRSVFYRCCLLAVLVAFRVCLFMTYFAALAGCLGWPQAWVMPAQDALVPTAQH